MPAAGRGHSARSRGRPKGSGSTAKGAGKGRSRKSTAGSAAAMAGAKAGAAAASAAAYAAYGYNVSKGAGAPGTAGAILAGASLEGCWAFCQVEQARHPWAQSPFPEPMLESASASSGPDAPCALVTWFSAAFRVQVTVTTKRWISWPCCFKHFSCFENWFFPPDSHFNN